MVSPPRGGALADRAGRLAPAAVIAFAALLIGFWVPGPANVSGDTSVLVAGAEAVVNCATTGKLRGCGTSRVEMEAARPPYDLKSAVGPFPVFQYVPLVVALRLGVPSQRLPTMIALLSIAALLGTLALVWLVSSRLSIPSGAPTLTLVLVTGPLLYYANSTFGEMQATFLLVLVVAVVLLRVHWALLAASAFLAAITKETAAPFVVGAGIIGLYSLVTDRGQGRPRAKDVAGIALGATLGVIVNVLFNVFRFGTIANEQYLHGYGGPPHAPIPEKIKLLAAMLVSPNGGLVFFWPLAVAFLVALVALVTFCAARGEWRHTWPALGILSLFTFELVGLANWWQPFGWWAWGPRLALPWILPLLLLGAGIYRYELGRLVRRITTTTPRLLAGAAVATIIALPHIGVLLRPALSDQFFRTNQKCGQTIAGNLTNSPRFYRCLDRVAWRAPPVLVTALKQIKSRRGLLFAFAMLASNVGLLVLAAAGWRLAETPATTATKIHSPC